MSRKDLMKRFVKEGYEFEDEWDLFEYVTSCYGSVNSNLVKSKKYVYAYGPGQILDGKRGEESIFKGLVCNNVDEVVDYIEAFDYDILNKKDVFKKSCIMVDENNKFILDIGSKGKHYFYMKGEISYFHGSDYSTDVIVVTFKYKKDVNERFFG